MFNMKSKKPTGMPKPPNAFFIGGLVGAGVGYVASLFLAPQKGEKTQKQLKQRAQKVSYKTLSELEVQLDALQKKLSETKGSQTGKPSRIHVDVQEEYDGRRRDLDAEVVEVKIEPQEDKKV